ncbi:MAG: 30S ribosomal protein S6 [Leptonema sp. (in: bacteria)]
MDENLREYDLIVILNPELGIEAAKEEVEGLFKDLNIKVKEFKNLGRRELNYERKKYKTGIYLKYNLLMDKSVANELIFRLNIQNQVLHYFFKNLAKK